MTRTIRFGLSTCPNDTYAYHAILEHRIETGDLRFECELLDVQELNEGLACGRFDVAKASFFAALHRAGEYGILPVGAALGFGVGPLLLASRPDTRPGDAREAVGPRVLCPGEQTTATLLYRIFHGAGRVEQTRFDRILPALARGEADFGVCIHEARFTWKRWGAHLVEDLGERFERETGAPLPLGGVLARHALGDELHRTIAAVLRASIDYAHAHPVEALATMRRYASELDDDVIRSHVDLYVNERTRDLGEPGRRALEALARRAEAAGLAPAGAAIRIVGASAGEGAAA